MPASPIRKLVPFAEEAKRLGRKVYHLNIGQPDIKTPDSALDAIRNLDKTVLEYSHSAGYESYRRKLALSYQNIGLDVDYTDIIITTGGSEAILFTLMSCMEPGDEVIIPEPFYANYNGFAIAAGGMAELISAASTSPLISSPNLAVSLLHANKDACSRLFSSFDLNRLFKNCAGGAVPG